MFLYKALVKPSVFLFYFFHLEVAAFEYQFICVSWSVNFHFLIHLPDAQCISF